MVQPSPHQIIHVIIMWHGLMPALWTVNVRGIVSIRSVRACIRIRIAHFNDVFVHMVSVDMMEMSVVEIILVSLMLNGGMTATRAVLMGVILMLVAIAHKNAFLVCWTTLRSKI
jgi:hypothetical protein